MSRRVASGGVDLATGYRNSVRLDVTSRGMEVFCLRYDPEDAATVQIRIGGLLRRDGTPWHERTRDGYFEIVSPDRHLMRGIWTMTKAYVKESLLLDEEPTTWRQAPGLT
jgi:hypothetical protein